MDLPRWDGWYSVASTLMLNRSRSREQLVADATVALSTALSVGSKYALLDNILWTWSNLDGKYDGCRWWSEAALRARDALRHEHAIPRRVLIERFSRSPASKSPRLRGCSRSTAPVRW